MWSSKQLIFIYSIFLKILVSKMEKAPSNILAFQEGGFSALLIFGSTYWHLDLWQKHFPTRILGSYFLYYTENNLLHRGTEDKLNWFCKLPQEQLPETNANRMNSSYHMSHVGYSRFSSFQDDFKNLFC